MKIVKGRDSIKGSRKDSEKSSMRDEYCEDLDMRAVSTIRICLAKNILANMLGISMAKVSRKSKRVVSDKRHLKGSVTKGVGSYTTYERR